MVVGCGELCVQIESGHENTKRSRPFRNLLPLRWNHVGWIASGPLATPIHRVAAAGQTAEGHGVGRWFGHCNRTCETKTDGAVLERQVEREVVGGRQG